MNINQRRALDALSRIRRDAEANCTAGGLAGDRERAAYVACEMTARLAEAYERIATLEAKRERRAG